MSCHLAWVLFYAAAVLLVIAVGRWITAGRRRPDPLDCPKGRHVYEVPSVYPPDPPMPGSRIETVCVHDCHCPAADPGHIHWAMP